MNKVLFSRSSDDWGTPSSLYKAICDKGYFDPCPLRADFNGLLMEWPDRVYVNPPFSAIREWVSRCIFESKKGKVVLLLIPARTDTKYFKWLWKHGCHFDFVTGRLKFGDSKNPAPFPVVFVYFIGNGYSSIDFVDRDDLYIRW